MTFKNMLMFLPGLISGKRFFLQKLFLRVLLFFILLFSLTGLLSEAFAQDNKNSASKRQDGLNSFKCSVLDIYLSSDKVLIKFFLSEPAWADFSLGTGKSFMHVQAGWAGQGENIVSMDLDKNHPLTAGTGVSIEVHLKKRDILYESSFGGLGNTDGRFISPGGIAQDFKNDLFIVDSGNDRVQKFSPMGVYLDQFGDFSWDDPSETSFDTGEITDGSFNDPLDVACGLNSIFVLDSENHRVSRFDRHFVFVCAFGGQGDYDGEFESLAALDIDDVLNIYVLDSENDCIQKFDVDGNFIMRYGRFGWSEGLLNSPEDLCCLPRGEAWVADTGNSRLVRYDEFGNFIRQTGPFYDKIKYWDPEKTNILNSDNGKLKKRQIKKKKSGKKAERKGAKVPEYMAEPVSIDTDKDLNVYAADARSGRIFTFDDMGRLMGYSGPFIRGTPRGLLVYENRNREKRIFVSDADHSRVHVFSVRHRSAEYKYTSPVKKLE